MRSNILPSLVVAGLLSALVFLPIDCATGSREEFGAEVTGKTYRPAWTETVVETHSIGDPPVYYFTTHDEYHPEEYWVQVKDLESDWNRGVQVEPGTWHAVQQSAIVRVECRAGRFTGWRYSVSVDFNP